MSRDDGDITNNSRSGFSSVCDSDIWILPSFFISAPMWKGEHLLQRQGKGGKEMGKEGVRVFCS